MTRARGWAIPYLAVVLGSPLGAAQVTPLYEMSFFAGQNFYRGTATDVGGNIDIQATPVIKFSEKWSLFPTYRGNYQGNRSIEELAGGGMLFQDSTGHNLLLKSVSTIGRWKIKPSVGARVEWLRETKDEEWGDGLFDHRRLSGGVEAEYAGSARTGGRVAYDYYGLVFPNYRSLESAQDPTLSRELVGEKVLDNTNHMLTLEGWAPLPARGRMDVTLLMDKRAYSDQPVVDALGDLTGTLREDTVVALSGIASYPFRGLWNLRCVGELGLGLGRQSSNQNHYDARKGEFNPTYYDYSEWRLAPKVTALFGGNLWRASLGGSYQDRNYDERPAQDSAGNSLSEPLTMSNTTLEITLRRDISEHLSIRFQSGLGWGKSNSDYDKVFQYNYKIADYMVGFTYAY